MAEFALSSSFAMNSSASSHKSWATSVAPAVLDSLGTCFSWGNKDALGSSVCRGVSRIGFDLSMATMTRIDEQSSFKQGKKAIRQNDARLREKSSGRTDYNPSLPDRKARILPILIRLSMTAQDARKIRSEAAKAQFPCGTPTGRQRYEDQLLYQSDG